MNGQLLSLSKLAMVVVLNDSLITLRTIVDGKPVDCLLDSGAYHNFLSLKQCNKKGLKVKKGDLFGVRLADGQKIPAVGKVHCFIVLGPMKTALTFNILDCNVPCVLGIPFLQTINPTIDWATHSVQVHTTTGISPLEVISQGNKP